MKSTTTGTRKRLLRWTAWPEWGLLGPALIGALLLMCVLLASSPVAAYSYAEAGTEPLLEWRQTLLKALAEKDEAALGEVVPDVLAEADYLDVRYATELRDALEDAVAARDTEQVTRLMNQVFALKVIHRLELAEESLDDYQKAKVLVAKTRAYMAPLMPGLPPPAREEAERLLHECVQAVGQPGVFGAGAVPPDRDGLVKARKQLAGLLRQHLF